MAQSQHQAMINRLTAQGANQQTPAMTLAVPTPAASPMLEARATGLTPNAKRPMNRESIAVAITGGRM